MGLGDVSGSASSTVLFTASIARPSELCRTGPTIDLPPSNSFEGAVIGPAGVAGFWEQFGPSQGRGGAGGRKFDASAATVASWEASPHAAARPGENPTIAKIANAIPTGLFIGM